MQQSDKESENPFRGIPQRRNLEPQSDDGVSVESRLCEVLQYSVLRRLKLTAVVFTAKSQFNRTSLHHTGAYISQKDDQLTPPFTIQRVDLFTLYKGQMRYWLFLHLSFSFQHQTNQRIVQDSDRSVKQNNLRGSSYLAPLLRPKKEMPGSLFGTVTALFRCYTVHN